MVFEILGPSKMHVWNSLGHRVGALAALPGGAAGASHDDPGKTRDAHDPHKALEGQGKHLHHGENQDLEKPECVDASTREVRRRNPRPSCCVGIASCPSGNKG